VCFALQLRRRDVSPSSSSSPTAPNLPCQSSLPPTAFMRLSKYVLRTKRTPISLIRAPHALSSYQFLSFRLSSPRACAKPMASGMAYNSSGRLAMVASEVCTHCCGCGEVDELVTRWSVNVEVLADGLGTNFAGRKSAARGRRQASRRPTRSHFILFE